jgi:xanthine dehydrogenase accessory factor
MSFPLDALKRHTQTGPVARVVVAGTKGSTPRGVGTSMIVTPESVHGTIGGGALEYDAIASARWCLTSDRSQVTQTALGPGLGQCCGGAVTLLTEIWTEDRLRNIDGPLATRPMPGRPAAKPEALRRVEAWARESGATPEAQIVDGWFIEPVERPDCPVWIYGAGHVGLAMVDVLGHLPGLSVTLIDDRVDRFQEALPDCVTPLAAQNPSEAVAHAPGMAMHYVMTYSHAMDLEICHKVLSRDFRTLGLIGSESKRARFRKRLANLGHTPEQINRMRCPIGAPDLGKHPQAIAIGVAAEILRTRADGVGEERKQA